MKNSGDILIDGRIVKQTSTANNSNKFVTRMIDVFVIKEDLYVTDKQQITNLNNLWPN